MKQRLHIITKKVKQSLQNSIIITKKPIFLTKMEYPKQPEIQIILILRKPQQKTTFGKTNQTKILQKTSSNKSKITKIQQQQITKKYKKIIPIKIMTKPLIFHIQNQTILISFNQKKIILHLFYPNNKIHIFLCRKNQLIFVYKTICRLKMIIQAKKILLVKKKNYIILSLLIISVILRLQNVVCKIIFRKINKILLQQNIRITLKGGICQILIINSPQVMLFLIFNFQICKIIYPKLPQ
ncbi:hypothetical protein IMG5_170840 [Ichthyophthirius multifiliis]|uniref:Transmembrane protein n=1 Tax=Ichthyophthirius multifiliis TaxID=5932 RepID=G0R1I9_ICHMU|nr:hypothetical protein IMG5_170840 [Ichthyophthirius multifiliis]EGR28662.1 hypothetical protein IMG5_170840 [Ichthyophthirius multifiliis]|eukprot:XP_004029898.1 hypothetical protein IMG5_170840 [Ichthyophthirius multifiliis]